MATRAIVWLRRDLRLIDNAALVWASENAEQLVLAYVHAPEEDGSWAPGAASRWWLHQSLAALSAELGSLGQRLVIMRGPTLDALRRLIAATDAQLVCWNRLYEPASIARDTEIKRSLQTDGIQARSFNSALLFEPWEVLTEQDQPYRVFTPFWRRCLRRIDQLPPPMPRPRSLPQPARGPASEPLEALQLLPRIAWDAGLAATWTPGERAAHDALERFLGVSVARYDEGRNRPDQPATSRLSPHLHFGELSPRQVMAAIQLHDLRGAARQGAESFMREIGWREFAYHLLFHFPQTIDQPMDERFCDYRWSRSRSALEAWQRGRTGIPLVDAGMRELWTTGWMHNRVRMVVASLLTKNLRLNWLEGARWFWDTLVDADLASNTLGWQWTAGCGADAAPYFRIFNPVLQAQRYDPDRSYLRRWLPELERLPDRWIHRPWEAPADVLTEAGVTLGRDYPRPIVDLRASRDAALEGYERMKQAQLR